MADYRRKLAMDEHRNIVHKYKPHRDAQGGIFVSRTRRRLLGIKDESSDLYREDTADFWSDVRTNVKNALTDLQLICEVANEDQLKEMFQLIPFTERTSDKTKTSLADVFGVIFQDHNRLVMTKLKDGTRMLTRTRDVDDLWKAELACEIVERCLEFFKVSGLITSKVHERLVEEVIDMLGSEYSQALSREMKLPYYAKFR